MCSNIQGVCKHATYTRFPMILALVPTSAPCSRKVSTRRLLLGGSASAWVCCWGPLLLGGRLAQDHVPAARGATAPAPTPSPSAPSTSPSPAPAPSPCDCREQRDCVFFSLRTPSPPCPMPIALGGGLPIAAPPLLERFLHTCIPSPPPPHRPCPHDTDLRAFSQKCVFGKSAPHEHQSRRCWVYPEQRGAHDSPLYPRRLRTGSDSARCGCS